MSYIQSVHRALGFGGRLAVMMVGLVACAILAASVLAYQQYRDSFNRATLQRLQSTGDLTSASITGWLRARRDEMAFIAQLDATVAVDLAQINHFLQRIADQQGVYDTIFFVGPDGRGVAGVSYERRARVLTPQEAYEFNVADREWFRTAIRGEEVFSLPLVSRATGNQISNVVVPVYQGNRVVGVIRGAVSLNTLFEKVQALSLGGGSDIYLLGRDGTPITAVAALRGATGKVTTAAAEALSGGSSGMGQYRDAAGVEVVGSYTFIPMLGWGLVLELPLREVLADVHSMLRMMVFVALAIMVVAGGLSLLLARSVVSILGGEPEVAASVVQRIASGDLTVTVPVRQGDTASLLHSIRQMLASLQKMIGDVSRYSDEVAAAATQLAQVNRETEQGIDIQNEQVNSVAVAINEMTATTEEVSRNTQQAAQDATQASDAAGAGNAVVNNAIDAIEALADEVRNASEVINTLKRDSDNISSVLQVIRDVAEQTNLLALNAAIEAARAGEEGRGFAVVADEVRTLASRTQSSAAQIQETVEQLQSRADGATRVMQASCVRAGDGVSQVTRAGESLTQIVSAVEKIDEMIQQIAAATEEQTQVALSINDNVHRVSGISERNAENVEQSKQASESLAHLAEELRALVQQFRL